MKKIINLLILSIVFSPLAHSEPSEGESNLSEICKSAIMMSVFASGIENACGFRDGLSGKCNAFFISNGCKLPEGKSGEFEKAQSEVNASLEKDIKAKGQKVGCRSARESYVQMIQALKELQAVATQVATKPDLDAEYYPVSLDDLKIDAESLNGRKVRVSGLGYYVMNSFMLKKSVTDMSPIFVNIDNLKRDQKLQILKQCGDIMSGCSVGVYGTAGKVSYQNGVIAENIKW